MADDKKQNVTLTDDEMVTSPKLSRRLLIAGAGVALGAATLGGTRAFADDTGKDAEKDPEMDKGGPEEKDPGADATKDAEMDKGGEEGKDEGNDEEMSEKDSD